MLAAQIRAVSVWAEAGRVFDVERQGESFGGRQQVVIASQRRNIDRCARRGARQQQGLCVFRRKRKCQSSMAPAGLRRPRGRSVASGERDTFGEEYAKGDMRDVGQSTLTTCGEGYGVGDLRFGEARRSRIPGGPGERRVAARVGAGSAVACAVDHGVGDPIQRGARAGWGAKRRNVREPDGRRRRRIGWMSARAEREGGPGGDEPASHQRDHLRGERRGILGAIEAAERPAPCGEAPGVSIRPFRQKGGIRRLGREFVRPVAVGEIARQRSRPVHPRLDARVRPLARREHVDKAVGAFKRANRRGGDMILKGRPGFEPHLVRSAAMIGTA